MPNYVVVRGPGAVFPHGADRALAVRSEPVVDTADSWRVARQWATTSWEPASIRRTAVHAAGTFVVASVLALLAVAYVPVLLGRAPVLVSSGSMRPLLEAGDVVVIDPPRPDIDVGNVISFEADDRSILHRVVEVTDTGFRTKGDANIAADSTTVSPEDVNGVGVMAIPYVGSPHLLYAQRRWLELAAVLTFLVLSFTVSTDRWLHLRARNGR